MIHELDVKCIRATLPPRQSRIGVQCDSINHALAIGRDFFKQLVISSCQRATSNVTLSPADSNEQYLQARLAPLHYSCEMRQKCEEKVNRGDNAAQGDIIPLLSYRSEFILNLS